MLKNTRSKTRREESLTRDSIIEASIALLDSSGESGLTFRALADRLATGAGAIYWHINNKNDLLIAACDAVVARTLDTHDAATPKAAIRKLALGMFDVMDAHPWVGSALIQAACQLPTVRILERIGKQVRALGVQDDAQWIAVSSLLHYILGVGGQNAANTQFARAHDLDRSRFLGDISAAWLELDAEEFPFTRSMAGQLRAHDDREDFLAGIDLILSGIAQSGS